MPNTEEVYGLVDGSFDYSKLANLKVSQEQYQHWLWNSYSENYWVTKDNSVTIEVWNGYGFTNYKAATSASAKPVIH